MTKIYDTFSRRKERDLPLERINEIVILRLEQGVNDPDYDVLIEDPVNITDNDRMCRDELLSENKKVAYLLSGDEVIAVIGYKDS